MLKSLELSGFKSFARPTSFVFETPITAIVGPNGSGKSNTAEAFRFALGEQSKKALRGETSEDFLFHGSKNAPRANRASVKVLFDNSNRILNLDFPEVAVERTMFRDSSHVYSINEAQVRLKDVTEILAGANIGPTGHHIISQGEADRILLVRPRDRRQMIEDALGLKIYHNKHQESARKLAKTREHISEVKQELAAIVPERMRLEREMERIRKASAVALELGEKAGIFLALIDEYYDRETKELERRLEDIEREHDNTFAHVGEVVADEDDRELLSEISDLEEELQFVKNRREELVQEKGRLEGKIEVLSSTDERGGLNLSSAEVSEWQDKFYEAFERQSLNDLRLLVDELLSRKDTEIPRGLIAESSEMLDRIGEEIDEALEAEGSTLERLEILRKQIEDTRLMRARREEAQKMGVRNKEKLMQEAREVQSKLQRLEEEKREDESRVVSIGIMVARSIRPDKGSSSSYDLNRIRNELERLAIRYEELQVEDGKEIERAYEDVRERSDLLEREITDLSGTIDSLSTLMEGLSHELRVKFREGIDKINDEFDSLFKSMFGGGSASIVVVADGDEEGVEVDVSLPFKRVRGLSMLSGGERSLVSIALVFALSRVNPPPFLILDETDAALDEANSRRYGDCIQELAKHSQLVIITHNRETMSRAGVLYGVTMGNDGISRLLSVKLEDAQAFAAR